jgi:hypothetical protein
VGIATKLALQYLFVERVLQMITIDNLENGLIMDNM